MAETLSFDLVSPERRVASMEAAQVAIPGSDGDLAVGPGHEPTITTLRPGILRVETPAGVQEFAVTGGFAEVSPEGVTVLAERSMAASDLTQETYDAYVAEAEADARRARESAEQSGDTTAVDEAAKLMGDMVAMGTHVGLSTRQSNL